MCHVMAHISKLPATKTHIRVDMTVLKEIYNLKDNKALIKRAQDTSLDKSSLIGLKVENGLLFGSKDWFNAIETGEITVQTITGTISNVFMTGHNDYPEFEIDSNGNKTKWTREGIDSAYVVGRQVELIYVTQKTKRGAMTKCVVKINISADI